MISHDHQNLGSNEITNRFYELVKSNPSIPVKSLIADIKGCHGYIVTYKKA